MTATFEDFVRKARTTVLLKRQDHSNVGEARVTPDTAWWMEVCKNLWNRVDALEAATSTESAEGAEIKRGPGRPPKVQA